MINYQNTLVSVVMPVCNGQEFINMAIDSILNQTHKNLELIIVDYGSSDNTASIISNYTDPRISYTSSNKTIFEEALNYGIELSKGRLVALMGQADMALPDRIKNQLTFMKQNEDVALCATNFDVIDENSNVIDRQATDNDSADLDPAWLAKNLIANTSAMLVKEKILELGGYKLGEALTNYDLWKRVAAHFKIGLLQERDYGLRILQQTLHRNGKYRVGSGLKLLKDEDYALWIQLAGSASGFSLGAADQTDAAYLRLKDIDQRLDINRLLVKASNNPSLTNTQRLIIVSSLEELNSRQITQNKKSPAVVSVVMSIYNGERFLRPAIHSILNQTFKDFEFIIIDDGSTDDSATIVREINDRRIRLVSQTNHGFIYSLNKGVQLANGKFIARMDQDDISLPTRLEKQLELLNKDPRVGAVSTFFELINFENSKPLGTTMVFPVKSIDIKRALYVHNPMAHGSTTFRKQAWQRAGKYRADYHPPEDYDLWRRIAKDWDLAIIPEVLFQYRINNPDSMSQKTIPILEHNLQRIKTELIADKFFSKSIISTFTDFKNINQTTYGKLSGRVREAYVDLQLNLVKVFLAHASPLRAVVPMVFVVILQPRTSIDLLKKFPRSIIRNLKRRIA